ncbi:helix-turn-helix domain-containing protein [Peptoniphilus sp.]|jgi:two-component system response regulator YesN|uniref:helix-turn-helix domain-containing protein n=1 Tax=Peptoniphilus sp. TaxID=1971214 RepID=UPI003D8B6FA0
MDKKNANIDEFLDILDNPDEEGIRAFRELKNEIYKNNILKGIVIDILKCEYIYNYIYGNMERAKNARPIFDLFNLSINPNMVLTIIYDNFWMICEKDDNTQRYKLKRKLIDATNFLLRDVKSIATTLIGTDKVIVLIDCDKRSPEESTLYVEDIANKLLVKLEEITHYSVSIGMSSYKNDVRHINDAYEESFRALDNIFKKGRGSIVRNESENNIQGEHLDIYKYLHDITINIGHGNSESAHEIIDNISTFFKRQNYDPNYIKSISITYIFEFSNYFNFEENKNNLNPLVVESIDELIKSTTINEISRVLKKYIDKIISSLEKSDTLKRGINISISYIKKYYMLDISLEKISYIAGFSPYYFSRNFKKITGINFIDYLMKTRIENAKTLLKVTDKTVLEISLEVGFLNFSYFSKTFKNFVGMTPTEFRRKSKS